MIYQFETLPIENKEVLRQGILELFDRDIATVPCAFSSRNYAFLFGEGCFPAVIRVGVESTYRKAADVLSELMWIDDLKNDVSTICQPIPSLQNRMVERIAVGDLIYLATMFRKANGAVLPEKKWDKNYFYNAGALLGEIHRTSSEGTQRGFRYKRRQWDESMYFDFSCFDEYFGPSARRDAEAVLEKIKSIPRDPRWYGMIHGDYHSINMFCDWGDLWAFDFDDCCYGYFMFDIACIAQIFSYSKSYASAHPNQTARDLLLGEEGFLTLFRAGYSSAYPLPEEFWAQFHDFFRLRVAQIFTIQITHKLFPREVILALGEPSLELLKYDRDPVDKIEELMVEVARRMPIEQLVQALKKQGADAL